MLVWKMRAVLLGRALRHTVRSAPVRALRVIRGQVSPWPAVAAVLLAAVLVSSVAFVAAQRAAGGRRPPPRRLAPVPLTAHPGLPRAWRAVTVAPGQTLWQIAAVYLHDGAAWPRIWAANRATVADPAVLTPGQVIFVPVRHRH
jgi:nucleoid-associated protein YgaU